MNKILFLAGVHGDEPDAPNILKKLKENNELTNADFFIANPKALKLNKRFVALDMNRNAPGSLKSNKYESRQVIKVLKKAQKYQFVIDLHGSKGQQGVFTIIPKLTIRTLFLSLSLPVKRILIWPYNPNTKRGPIMKFINCGVGIEFGPKETPAIQAQVLKVIKTIDEEGFNFGLDKSDKEIYFVYDRVRKVPDISLFKDFQEIEFNGEKFYPCFIGAYRGIAFYKTRKIELDDLLKEKLNFERQK